MLYSLKRHPIPVQAWFDFSLVLTYALPAEILAPHLPKAWSWMNLPATALSL
jgi:hypothetical protein